jgi:hypothetical protein
MFQNLRVVDYKAHYFVSGLLDYFRGGGGGARGSVVVKALYYKPGGRGFETRSE